MKPSPNTPPMIVGDRTHAALAVPLETAEGVICFNIPLTLATLAMIASQASALLWARVAHHRGLTPPATDSDSVGSDSGLSTL